jgi:BASS family bile acid:Na+ symporter
MHLLAHFALPPLIMLAMAVVGLELTTADFRRVLHYPIQVAACLIGQVVLLPLVGAALIVLLRPQPAVAGGLILVAAAPQAIISNYFCLLARADIALSVTLTATSTLLAVASTPLIAGWAFDLLMEPQAGVALPAAAVMQQVVTGLLLPIAAGMGVRRYAPGLVQRQRTRLKALSLIAIAAVLLIVLVSQADMIARNFGPIVSAAVLFTALAAVLGLAVAKALRWPRVDVVTAAVGFPARSLSVAALIAVNVLGRLEFLSFAAVFFLAQAAVLVPAILLTRPSSAPA